MKIVLPLTIVDSMIVAGTSIAEPDSSETAWVSAATYAVGDKRIRTTTHRIYKCASAHTGRTALPEADPTYWVDIGPTLRWAPFDSYVSTPATATGGITYVMRPGYCNAIALYGLVGSSATVSIKDSPGGTVIFNQTLSLYDDPAGWYEYLFLPVRPRTKLVFKNLPIRANPEITISINSASGGAVAVGMIVLGDYRSLVSELADFGGTESGATAEPITYSYIKTADDGTTSIVRRHAATGMRAMVVMPRSDADAALRLVQDVLDIPVGWVASDEPGFDGLNVFGLGSARLTYTSAITAQMEINVKGMI